MRENIFRKNFLWRHNDVIKNVYFFTEMFTKVRKTCIFDWSSDIFKRDKFALFQVLYSWEWNEVNVEKKFFWIFLNLTYFFSKKVFTIFFFFTNFFLNLGYIARMFSETMKDSRNLFFAYCLWHIGDGSARKFFFEKTSYDVIMTSSKTSIFYWNVQ